MLREEENSCGLKGKRGTGSCFRATDGSRITVNGSRLMVKGYD